MTVSIHPTMSVLDIHPVVVVVCGDVDPTAEDNTLAIADVERTKHQLCLVYAADVGLTASQRRQIGDLVTRQKLKVAVMIGSAVTRGVVTALIWLTRQDHFRMFGLDELNPALDYLGQPRSTHETFRQGIEDARRKMASLTKRAASG